MLLKCPKDTITLALAQNLTTRAAKKSQQNQLYNIKIKFHG